MHDVTATTEGWPTLVGIELGPTIEALHLWSQIAGKVRLMMTPWMNHSWHVPLYLSVRGITTGLIPAGERAFEMEFNVMGGTLDVRDTTGRSGFVSLETQSVATFYSHTMRVLESLDLPVEIDCCPCEIQGAVPFPDDHQLRPYNAEVARTYWQAMLQVQRVFHLFRTRFVGKCSPVHLFWGSFDLAVTRFSGKSAPAHPGGAPHMPDSVARDAYNQEVSSAGFWPGGGKVGEPSFYSYAYPMPAGFQNAHVEPSRAYFETELGEFLLPYETVRASADPDGTLLSFLQSTYEAAANLGQWERSRLEGPQGGFGQPPEGA